LIARTAQADQLAPLWAPHAVCTGEHKCGPSTGVVLGSTDDGRIAIRGQRNRVALLGLTGSAAGSELLTLLDKVGQRRVEWQSRPKECESRANQARATPL
jgi:hypothetical protein